MTGDLDTNAAATLHAAAIVFVSGGWGLLQLSLNTRGAWP
jgi:hypothetical protein